MTINEYQKLAMRTANPGCRMLTNVGLGFAGESGEVADLFKKHIHQGHPLSMKKLIEELGDVAWYIALGCEVMGVSMEEVLEANINKLRRRYPDGFSADRSVNRKEGE